MKRAQTFLTFHGWPLFMVCKKGLGQIVCMGNAKTSLQMTNVPAPRRTPRTMSRG